MTMQLAPIPPRKVEFTPEACLEVVERWLEKEYKLTPAKSEILYARFIALDIAGIFATGHRG